MPPGATARSHAQIARRQIEIVVDDDERVDVDCADRLERLTAAIHERLRLDEQRSGASDGTASATDVTGGVQLDLPSFGQHIDDHESDVVTGARVLSAGIAETHDHPHIARSRPALRRVGLASALRRLGLASALGRVRLARFCSRRSALGSGRLGHLHLFDDRRQHGDDRLVRVDRNLNARRSGHIADVDASWMPSFDTSISM